MATDVTGLRGFRSNKRAGAEQHLPERCREPAIALLYNATHVFPPNKRDQKRRDPCADRKRLEVGPDDQKDT